MNKKGHWSWIGLIIGLVIGFFVGINVNYDYDCIEENYNFNDSDNWEERYYDKVDWCNNLIDDYVKLVDDWKRIADEQKDWCDEMLDDWEELYDDEIDYYESESYPICSYNAYNCVDFVTSSEAQAVMEYCGKDDIHQLDRDKDGLACEWN